MSSTKYHTPKSKRPRCPGVQDVASLNVSDIRKASATLLEKGVVSYFVTLFASEENNNTPSDHEGVAKLVVELALENANWRSKDTEKAVNVVRHAFCSGKVMVSDTEYMKSGKRHYHVTFLSPPLTPRELHAFKVEVERDKFFCLAKLHEGVPDAHALGLNRSEEVRTVLTAEGSWQLRNLVSAIRYTRKSEHRKKNLLLLRNNPKTGKEEPLPELQLTDGQFKAVLEGKNGALITRNDLGLYIYRRSSEKTANKGNRREARPHRLVPRNGTQGNFAIGDHRKALFHFMKDNGLNLNTTVRQDDCNLMQHLFAHYNKRGILEIDLKVRIAAYAIEHNFKFYKHDRSTVLDALREVMGLSKEQTEDPVMYGEFMRACARRVGVRYQHNGYVDPLELVIGYVIRIEIPQREALKALKERERIEAKRSKKQTKTAKPSSVRLITPQRQAP